MRKVKITAFIMSVILTLSFCIEGCSVKPSPEVQSYATEASRKKKKKSKAKKKASPSTAPSEAAEPQNGGEEELPIDEYPIEADIEDEYIYDDGNIEYSEENGMIIDAETGKDEYNTEPVPKGMPIPVEPQEAVVTDKKLTCTFSIRCDAILNNMNKLNKEKIELIPHDGVILPAASVEFNEGESVFDVLLRETKKQKIHFDFSKTPAYNSVYVNGIGNIYELDCGDLSGWTYKVNGFSPNYGCSRYQLHDNDIVEWLYSCDLGKDI